MSAEVFVLKFQLLSDLDAVLGSIQHIQIPDIDRDAMMMTITSHLALREAIQFADITHIKMNMSIKKDIEVLSIHVSSFFFTVLELPNSQHVCWNEVSSTESLQ